MKSKKSKSYTMEDFVDAVVWTVFHCDYCFETEPYCDKCGNGFLGDEDIHCKEIMSVRPGQRVIQVLPSDKDTEERVHLCDDCWKKLAK